MPIVEHTPAKDVIYSYEKSLMTVFHSELPADSSMFYEHHHTAFEITMVLSGSGVYSTNNTQFDFESGDIFFFSTDEVHWIKQLDSHTKFLNIHFEPRFIWADHFGISGKELIKIFFNRKNKPTNKIDKNSEAYPIIYDLLFKIKKEAMTKKAEYGTIINVHLINILVEMIRSYGGQLSDDDAIYSTHTLHYTEKVLNYIDEHLGSDLTLAELSEVAHMSKNYFCRQFRKLNGISPWEYITIKRVEKAITYIESTDMTMLEIAIKCGYNNTSNFYYAFKRVTGKTPGDYKK